MIVVFWGVDALICFAFVVYKQRHSDPRFFALDTLCIVRGGGVKPILENIRNFPVF